MVVDSSPATPGRKLDIGAPNVGSKIDTSGSKLDTASTLKAGTRDETAMLKSDTATVRADTAILKAEATTSTDVRSRIANWKSACAVDRADRKPDYLKAEASPLKGPLNPIQCSPITGNVCTANTTGCTVSNAGIASTTGSTGVGTNSAGVASGSAGPVSMGVISCSAGLPPASMTGSSVSMGAGSTMFPKGPPTLEEIMEKLGKQLPESKTPNSKALATTEAPLLPTKTEMPLFRNLLPTTTVPTTTNTVIEGSKPDTGISKSETANFSAVTGNSFGVANTNCSGVTIDGNNIVGTNNDFTNTAGGKQMSAAYATTGNGLTASFRLESDTESLRDHYRKKMLRPPKTSSPNDGMPTLSSILLKTSGTLAASDVTRSMFAGEDSKPRLTPEDTKVSGSTKADARGETSGTTAKEAGYTFDKLTSQLHDFSKYTKRDDFTFGAKSDFGVKSEFGMNPESFQTDTLTPRLKTQIPELSESRAAMLSDSRVTDAGINAGKDENTQSSLTGSISNGGNFASAGNFPSTERTSPSRPSALPGYKSLFDPNFTSQLSSGMLNSDYRGDANYVAVGSTSGSSSRTGVQLDSSSRLDSAVLDKSSMFQQPDSSVLERQEGNPQQQQQHAADIPLQRRLHTLTIGEPYIPQGGASFSERFTATFKMLDESGDSKKSISIPRSSYKFASSVIGGAPSLADFNRPLERADLNRLPGRSEQGEGKNIVEQGPRYPDFDTKSRQSLPDSQAFDTNSRHSVAESQGVPHKPPAKEVSFNKEVSYHAPQLSRNLKSDLNASFSRVAMSLSNRPPVLTSADMRSDINSGFGNAANQGPNVRNQQTQNQGVVQQSQGVQIQCAPQHTTGTDQSATQTAPSFPASFADYKIRTPFNELKLRAGEKQSTQQGGQPQVGQSHIVKPDWQPPNPSNAAYGTTGSSMHATLGQNVEPMNARPKESRNYDELVRSMNQSHAESMDQIQRQHVNQNQGHSGNQNQSASQPPPMTQSHGQNQSYGQSQSYGVQANAQASPPEEIKLDEGTKLEVFKANSHKFGCYNDARRQLLRSLDTAKTKLNFGRRRLFDDESPARVPSAVISTLTGGVEPPFAGPRIPPSEAGCGATVYGLRSPSVANQSTSNFWFSPNTKEVRANSAASEYNDTASATSGVNLRDLDIRSNTRSRTYARSEIARSEPARIYPISEPAHRGSGCGGSQSVAGGAGSSNVTGAAVRSVSGGPNSNSVAGSASGGGVGAGGTHARRSGSVTGAASVAGYPTAGAVYNRETGGPRDYKSAENERRECPFNANAFSERLSQFYQKFVRQGHHKCLYDAEYNTSRNAGNVSILDAAIHTCGQRDGQKDGKISILDAPTRDKNKDAWMRENDSSWMKDASPAKKETATSILKRSVSTRSMFDDFDFEKKFDLEKNFGKSDTSTRGLNTGQKGLNTSTNGLNTSTTSLNTNYKSLYASVLGGSNLNVFAENNVNAKLKPSASEYGTNLTSYILSNAGDVSSAGLTPSKPVANSVEDLHEAHMKALENTDFLNFTVKHAAGHTSKARRHTITVGSATRSILPTPTKKLEHYGYSSAAHMRADGGVSLDVSSPAVMTTSPKNSFDFKEFEPIFKPTANPTLNKKSFKDFETSPPRFNQQRDRQKSLGRSIL